MLKKIQKYVATKGKVTATDISIALNINPAAVEMSMMFFIQKKLINKIEDCSSKDICGGGCGNCSLSVNSKVSYQWTGERIINMNLSPFK